MATSFTDSKGRTWCLDLDLPTADEVKLHRGLDLIDAEKFIENIAAIAAKGTEFLVNVLWTIVYRQAEAAGVSDEDFGRAMKPQVVGEAAAALKEAIIDFFRPLNPAKAETLRRILAKAEEAVNLVGENSLDLLDERLANLVQGLTSESSFGNMRESPDSIQPSEA